MKSKRRFITIIAAASGILIIILVASGLFSPPDEMSPDTAHDHEMEDAADEDEILYWTCSMHPEIRLPEPVPCPICAMDLIPVYREDDLDPDRPVISLTEARAKLAGIETQAALKRDLTLTLNFLGTVSFDETRMAEAAAWFPGRVEKLHVNFVGDYVRKGEPLLKIYSPELRSVQQEFLTALARVEQMDEPSPGRLRSLESARRRLELLGMLPAQIEELEDRRYAGDTIDFYSPISGVVVERNAYEGGHFNTGEVLFHIADLSSVWIMADAYEKDFDLVETGQEIKFIARAYPSESFRGEVVFIDPVVDRGARTARLRMEVKNPDGLLKPGMYGTAVLSHELGEHLSIPRAAALLAGDAAVVYVEEEPLLYTGREVVLGPGAGDYYPVVSGLSEDEAVVTRGNFKLDAALQIRDRPAMMRLMEGRAEPAVDVDPHMHHTHAAQEICPVMGGEIDRELYADINGYRVYVCCPGCIPELEDNPEKYLEKLRGEGVDIETLRAVTE